MHCGNTDENESGCMKFYFSGDAKPYHVIPSARAKKSGYSHWVDSYRYLGSLGTPETNDAKTSHLDGFETEELLNELLNRNKK